MSLQGDLDALERVYREAAAEDLERVEPIRQPPHCLMCGQPISNGIVHLRGAVRPDSPFEPTRWHAVLCAGCAAG
jgi:hypothetical protein